MAEVNPTFPVAATAARRNREPLGNSMLSAIETILDPGVLVLSLWFIVISIEGELLPPYLIFSIIVFSLTFPGTSRLQSSLSELCIDILYAWFWVALLLIFLGFATGYLVQFSNQALRSGSARRGPSDSSRDESCDSGTPSRPAHPQRTR